MLNLIVYKVTTTLYSINVVKRKIKRKNHA